MARSIYAAAFLLLSATAAMAQSVDTLYFLPKSVITISGTVTTKKTFTAEGLKDAVEPGPATVSLGVAADPTAHYIHRADSKLLSKQTYKLELAAGMITGLNGVSEGQAGTILKSVIGLITGIARIGSGSLFSASSPAEVLYAGDFPELSTRRSNVRRSIETMLDKILALEQRLVAEPDLKKRADLRVEIEDLAKAVAHQRAEAEPLDAHFTAWKTRKEDARDQAYEWTLDITDLPVDGGSKWKVLKDVTLGAQMKEIVDGLRIVVSRETPTLNSTAATPPSGTASDALYHRIAIPSVLRVYKVAGDGALVLAQRTTPLLLTSASPVGTLPAPDSKWSKRTVEATFTNGSLTKVGTESSSELAGATEALRGIPTEYLAGLKQANEIDVEERKLKLQGLDTQIERLKKVKEATELDLAQQQLLSVGNGKNSIAALETQIKLLETERALGDSRGAAADRNAIRLENELAKLQIEQAELRRKLEALIEKSEK